MNTQERNSITIQTLADTEKLAAEILRDFPEHKIVLLQGDLGAGKTTLVQAFCRKLQTIETAKSPSFSIINEYHSLAGPVYHFDFYRIEAEEEAQELGLEEYWDSGYYCFLEWPEMIPSFLPRKYLSLRMELSDSGSRKIQILPVDSTLF
jgi:tRNA threonylcarbamoyladenosine biosynthesis protein TsaE